MLVSGGAAYTPGLIETLGRKFEIPAERFDSFRRIARDSKRFSSSLPADGAPELAVAIGLALRKGHE
jgi:Tfp pilus assembly PilM family ATPase